MSTPDTAPEAAVGTVQDTEAVELTEQDRMSKASEEVAAVLNKYRVTISVQNVPVIVPAQAGTAPTDLKA